MQKIKDKKRFFLNIVTAIIMLGLLVCFIILGQDIGNDNTDNIIYKTDTLLYDFVLDIRCTPLTILFKIITNLCNPFIMGIIAICLLFTRKINKQYIFAMFLNMGLTALLNLSLKYIIRRDRPDITQRLIYEPGYSFPSGHAMFAIAFYGFFIYLLFKSAETKRSTKILSTITIAFFMGLVCFSRVYLGVHYLSDVIGGICITIVYMIVFTSILDRNSFLYSEPATEYKKHSLFGGFKYAFRGIVESIQDENNLLVQFSASMLVITFAVFLRCTFAEWAILVITCFLVVCLEMVNTSIENLCDKITLEKDDKIRKVKDIAAGAVLMMSICSVIVAGVIFIPKIPVLF